MSLIKDIFGTSVKGRQRRVSTNSGFFMTTPQCLSVNPWTPNVHVSLKTMLRPALPMMSHGKPVNVFERTVNPLLEPGQDLVSNCGKCMGEFVISDQQKALGGLDFFFFFSIGTFGSQKKERELFQLIRQGFSAFTTPGLVLILTPSFNTNLINSRIMGGCKRKFWTGN